MLFIPRKVPRRCYLNWIASKPIRMWQRFRRPWKLEWISFFRLIIWKHVNLLTVNTNFRVTLKNLIPDKATSSFTTSFKKRSVSMFHDRENTSRRIWIGFFDSSFTLAIENDAAHIRSITNKIEYQEYTARKVVGNGLKFCKKKIRIGNELKKTLSLR